MILLVNQTIGPFFEDISNLLSKKYTIKIFKGIKYRRKFLIARLFTWTIYTIQLFIHLIIFRKRYEKILVVSNPPITQFIVGLFGISFSILIYDIYPNILSKLEIPNIIFRFIEKIWKFLNSKVYDRAEYIFTLSDEMSDELEIYFDSKVNWKKKVKTILPWVNQNLIRNKKSNSESTTNFKKDNTFIICYAGNLGLTHPIEFLVKGIKNLENKVKVVIIGDGPKRSAIYKLAKSQNNNICHFFDYMKSEKMLDTISSSDLAVVALDKEIANASLPSKTLTYLYAGTPILCIAPEISSVSRIIIKYNCGFVIEPNKFAPSAIDKLIKEILLNPKLLEEKKKNTSIALEKYSFKNCEKLVNLFIEK